MLKRAVKREENKEKHQNWNFSEKSNNSNDFTRFKKNKTILIIAWVILLIIIIASISGNSSDDYTPSNTYSNSKDYCPNWDLSASYYDDTCSEETNSTCLWEDWYYHTKVENSYCDNWSTPLWWSCKSWYSPKSEWKRTRDNDSWYCECNLSQVRCPSYADIKSDSMQSEIDREENYLNNMYVNQYSQSSVNNYNTQVQKVNNLISKRNRYMSENCDCSY